MNLRGRVKLLVGLVWIFMPLQSHPSDLLPVKPAPPPVGAPSNEQASGPTPLSLSITVSGGVSLGAYQAGYLYYFKEVIKRNPDLLSLKLVTGASAGMINSMVTVVGMGRPTEEEPAESLFFHLWTDHRYNELLDVKNAPPLALSSRKVLNVLGDLVEEQWNEGLDENLDMVLGATATRLKSYQVEISDGLTTPRQEEKFVFRVQGRGPGKQPKVTNYVDSTFGSERPVLPFQDVDTLYFDREPDNFRIIRQILFASSAIPIVFSPQKIDFCLTSPTYTVNESIYALNPCPRPKFTEEFVDGSLADRRPLRLAHSIASSGLEESDTGLLQWRDWPSAKTASLTDAFIFLYVDPTHSSYPPLESEESQSTPSAEANRLLSLLGVFMKGFLVSVRSKEVATLIDEHPEVRNQLQLASHDFPTVSGLLANFFGFFDRKFREFDFYLGMRDARAFLEQKITRQLQRTRKDHSLNLKYPEPETLNPEGTGSWRPFLCLRHVLDEKNQYQGACDSRKQRDFRILLQTSLDRLYDHCRQLPYDETIEHVHCKKAMMGNAPPRVLPGADAQPPNDNWKRTIEDGETHFAHSMRLLRAYKFQFTDLGLERDDAALAMSRIRAELLVYVDEFAKKLRFGERLAVRLLGKPAVNFFMYAPPETIVYFVAGTGAEIASSSTWGQSRWLRYNFALQLQGFYHLLSESPNVLALTPLLGVEAEIYPLSNPLFQTRIGLRIGYQFSSGDNFMKSDCDQDYFSRESLRCSAPVAQLFAAFSFYERVRLQGGIEWFPRWLPPMSTSNEHFWNGFLEFGWQWISPF